MGLKERLQRLEASGEAGQVFAAFMPPEPKALGQSEGVPANLTEDEFREWVRLHRTGFRAYVVYAIEEEETPTLTGKE